MTIDPASVVRSRLNLPNPLGAIFHRNSLSVSLVLRKNIVSIIIRIMSCIGIDFVSPSVVVGGGWLVVMASSSIRNGISSVRDTCIQNFHQDFDASKGTAFSSPSESLRRIRVRIYRWKKYRHRICIRTLLRWYPSLWSLVACCKSRRRCSNWQNNLYSKCPDSPAWRSVPLDYCSRIPCILCRGCDMVGWSISAGICERSY